MIVKLEGVIESVEKGAVHLRVGDVTYEVLVPAFTAARLGDSIGQTRVLHTIEYFESHNQGASMTPRIAGFLSPGDRRFFELFVSCKGIGNRKALRAMALESSQIAAAIADRDTALLQSLPEIGKRTAESIVTELAEKVGPFVADHAYPSRAASGVQAPPGSAKPNSMAREALEVLLQLGENRTQAVTWIDAVLRDQDRPRDAQELVSRVYRIKSAPGS
ncbi:MAG: hypothetical protein GC164_12345 [Phycisphaera sp.]|nr:hypothetical protein [Phycisphaera sp.]